jgi:uncharacterized membrane protein YfhO
VYVDGRRAHTEMVAPSFVGVQVSAGPHRVEFRYVPFPYYPELLVIGALALLAVGFAPRLRRRITR